MSSDSDIQHNTTPQPFYGPFWDHPGKPVPEENFWTLWCKGRLTKADTLTVQLGASPSGLTSAHLYHPPHFLQAECPSCHPSNSVKALKAPFTRYNLLSNRLSNGFDNQLNVCIHDIYTNIQPVVKPVVQPVVKPVVEPGLTTG